MPIERIGDGYNDNLFVDLPCNHPDHAIPTHVYMEPGKYKHTCAGCGKVTYIDIPAMYLSPYDRSYSEPFSCYP